MKQGPVFLKKLNRGGQAVIEYVLLLIVIITFLFLLKPVFSGLNAFMSDFMGAYIVCLIEHGELPALGVQNNDLKTHQTNSSRKCEFTNFSQAIGLGSGGTFGGGGGGGSGGVGSGGGSSQSSSSNRNTGGSSSRSGRSSGSSDSASAVDSSSGGSGGSSSFGRRGRTRSSGSGSSPYTNGMIQRNDGFRSADSGQVGAEAEKVTVLDVPKNQRRDDYDRESNRTRNFARGSTRGGRYVAITGAAVEEESKTMKPRTPAVSVQAIEEGYVSKPKKKTFRPPDQKTEFVVQGQEEEMGFGNFFKWLVIAGIVIAAFVLFGGQILSYSNSNE